MATAPLELYMVSDFISTAQGVLLAVAVVLLFTPSANRWFRRSDRSPYGSSTASQYR